MIRASERPVAVILDMGLGGLAIARSLGREGIRVFGLDFSSEYQPGLKSRYCIPFLASHPEKDPQPLLELLTKQAMALPEKAVLYPATEPYVRFVSEFRSELEAHFLFAIPSRDTVDSILDKRRQYDLADRLDIPYPVTWSPESPHDLDQMKDRIEYPAFIKPRYSKGIWSEQYRVKGFVVRNYAELTDTYRLLCNANHQVLVQSIVRGPDSNIYEVYVYISKDGVPLAAFVTRKLRQYPVMFGNATCMVSDHNDDVLRIALEFFRGIDYRGLGSIEIKKDDRDGEYKLIEVNPRLGVQSIHATYAGLNFPLIQYMDLIGSPMEDIKLNDYKDGVKWLDMMHDLWAFLVLYRHGGLSVNDWLRSISDTDCHAYFAPDDLMPFLRQYASRFVHMPRFLVGRFLQSR